MMPAQGQTAKILRRCTMGVLNASRSLVLSLGTLLINYLLFHFHRPILDQYIYLLTIVNLLLVFINWGGRDHALKAIVKEPSMRGPIISSLLGARLLLFIPVLTVVMLSPLVIIQKFFIGGLVLLRSFGSISDAVLNTDRKFGAALLIELFPLLVICVLLVSGNSLSDAKFFAVFVALELVKMFAAFQFFREPLRKILRFKEALRLLRESAPFFLVSLTGFICARGDLYVLGLFMGKEQLSRYFILLNLVNFAQMVYAGMVGAFSPHLFRSSDSSFSSFRYYQVGAGALFAALAAVFIFFAGNFFFMLQLGLAQALVILLNIWIFSFVLGGMYHFTRLNRQTTIIMVLVISAFCNLALSFALIPGFGTTGALISNTAGLLCNALLLQLLSKSWKRSVS